MVYLLKMVIFHGYVGHNQMVNLSYLTATQFLNDGNHPKISKPPGLLLVTMNSYSKPNPIDDLQVCQKWLAWTIPKVAAETGWPSILWGKFGRMACQTRGRPRGFMQVDGDFYFLFSLPPWYDNYSEWGLPTYLGLNFCSCFFPFFHGGQAYAAYAAQAAAAAAAAAQAQQAQQAQAVVQPREDENGTRSMVDHLGFVILYLNSSQTPPFVTCLEPQVHTNPSISLLN